MKETLRKLIHLFFGLGLAIIVWYFSQITALLVLSVFLLAGILLIEVIHRGYRVPFICDLVVYCGRGETLPGRGALYLVVSSLACAAFFPATAAVSALVCVAVVDSIASLVGTRFGRHRIGNGKSFEGALFGTAVAAAALLFLLSPIAAISASIVAGLVELFSPLDDNLSIPLITGVVVTLLLAGT